MPQTLTALKLTSAKAVYHFIDFGEWDEALRGKGIPVRVNPSRRMVREIQAAQQSQDNEDSLRIVAQLIPREFDETPPHTVLDETPLTLDELKVWLAGSDDDDDLFIGWLLPRVFQEVAQHFLFVKRFTENGKVGSAPLTETPPQ